MTATQTFAAQLAARRAAAVITCERDIDNAPPPAAVVLFLE